jgi:uncharacterized membrane protein YuzA (DUF378 family)
MGSVLSKIGSVLVSLVLKPLVGLLGPTLIDPLLGSKGSLSRKLLYVVIGGVAAVLKARYPNLALPDTQYILDSVLALLACHTITDSAVVVATIIQQYFAQKYGRNVK